MQNCLDEDEPLKTAVGHKPLVTLTILIRMGVLAAGIGVLSACHHSTKAPAAGTTVYSIGGSISGLTSPGMELTNNGKDMVAVAPGATSFTFPTALDTNATFSVAISVQPTGQTCRILTGSATGTVTTYNIGTVVIQCLSAWVWQSGSTGGDSPGVYPQTQSGAGSGTPSARDSAASWTDSAGHFWLFGGEGIDSSGHYGYLNDLWEYTPGFGWLSAGWQRVAGGSSTNGAAGSYVAQGANAGNWPGARAGAIYWTDKSGNFWMFGGRGLDSTTNNADQYLDDLWEYVPGTGWSWVGGPNTASTSSASYPATPGVTSAQNLPGGRAFGVSWVDLTGNLWLMGGQGYDSHAAFGALNDLWKYVPGTGWTWEGGANAISALGSYGATGTASNVPGARYDALSWTDPSGNMWLFGGFGLATTATAGGLNDLWEYLPATGQWNFVSGSNTVGAGGVYGSEGTATAGNVPGSRYSPCGWSDASGNLYLFGGYGMDSTSTPGGLNDLWKFTPSTGLWTWVNGSEFADGEGLYGTLGTDSIGTSPGARYGAVSWVDPHGNLWFFGGYGIDVAGEVFDLNDLWEFIP
jgi:N-acetylneuraminic acid mutarotase